jgi:hypothetical protein
MSFWSGFKNIDRKFSWSFLGFVIGIIGIALALYVSSIQDNNPKIKFDILTNTNVIDLKEDVSKLELKYNGNTIGKDNHTLKILTLKIINNGSKNILKSDYDSENPLGFYLKYADIIETPQLISASSNYLFDNIKVSSATKNEYTFSTVIIEKEEYFIVKILTLCEKNKNPEIIPIGKIAGVRNISVEESYHNNVNKKSIWHQVIDGTIFIHILRLIFYVFSFIIIILIIVVPAIAISEKNEKRKKNKFIKKFKNSEKYVDNELNNSLLKFYMEFSGYSLLLLKKILKNKDKLIKLVKQIEKMRENDEDVNNENMDEHEFYKRNRYNYDRDVIESRQNHIGYHALLPYIKELMDFKIINLEDNDVIVDPIFIKFFDSFIEYYNFYK